MKLPSIRKSLDDVRTTWFRFPLVIITSVIGTVVALVLIDHEGSSHPSVLFPVLLSSILGIPMFVFLALVAERQKMRAPLAWMVQGIGVLALIAYGFTVPQDLPNAPEISKTRFLLCAAILHLLVAWAPFAGRGGVNAFWQFNKTLLLRALVSYLFTMVLWAGLSGALAAVTKLFEVDVRGIRYLEMWAFLTGIFNTWYFLAGIPTDPDSLETDNDYPKPLKVLSQFVLLPLSLVYLAILYAYLAKILIEWSWPQGWVGGLTMGYTSVGLFSLLMLQPLVVRAGTGWLRMVSRWFYPLLIPILIMLFAAVLRRTSEYGMTESRYLVLAYGTWLFGIAVYFILSSSKNIKIIPLTLIIVVAAVSVGPWSAFAVSEQSQIQRLKILLERTGILVDSKIRADHGELSNTDIKEASAILSYLHNVHGYDGIQSWFAIDLKKDKAESDVHFKDPEEVTKLMGFEYVRSWQSVQEGRRFFNSDGNKQIVISGYDSMVRGQSITRVAESSTGSNTPIRGRFNEGSDSLTVFVSVGANTSDSIRISLHQLCDSLEQRYGRSNSHQIDPEMLTVSYSSHDFKVRIFFSQLVFEKKKGEYRPERGVADFAFSKGEAKRLDPAPH
jgi:hypothetical protein